MIVAVLDTGVRPEHPDLAGKLVPGYDFVSGTNSNDGGGRDADPSDPGDWVSQADIDNGVVDSDCSVESSTWHGTDVAGIIGAATNNGVGMAGVGSNVRLMNRARARQVQRYASRTSSRRCAGPPASRCPVCRPTRTRPA